MKRNTVKSLKAALDKLGVIEVHLHDGPQVYHQFWHPLTGREYSTYSSGYVRRSGIDWKGAKMLICINKQVPNPNRTPTKKDPIPQLYIRQMLWTEVERLERLLEYCTRVHLPVHKERSL